MGHTGKNLVPVEWHSKVYQSWHAQIPKLIDSLGKQTFLNSVSQCALVGELYGKDKQVHRVLWIDIDVASV